MLVLHIPDMSCGHCRKTIQSTVQAVDQQATVEFDMESRHVTVKTSADTRVLINALAEAGYSATAI